MSDSITKRFHPETLPEPKPPEHTVEKRMIGGKVYDAKVYPLTPAGGTEAPLRSLGLIGGINFRSALQVGRSGVRGGVRAGRVG